MSGKRLEEGTDTGDPSMTNEDRFPRLEALAVKHNDALDKLIILARAHQTEAERVSARVDGFAERVSGNIDKLSGDIDKMRQTLQECDERWHQRLQDIAKRIERFLKGERRNGHE